MPVCGVDEAGRGPLAGSVFAAAVILDRTRPIRGLTDSKALTEKKRLALEVEIRETAIAFCVSEASVAEIDALNILQASLLAMKRAVDGLQGAVPPLFMVLVDGLYVPKIDFPSRAIIDGDIHVAEISAASILAKNARDRVMCEQALRFPQYGFERHKGYGTKLHMDALMVLGPCEIHRWSFAPVREAARRMAMAAR